MSNNQSPRVIEIEKQLGFSFLLRGQKIPNIQELSFQASLIDAKLNPDIDSSHIELLFDISRVKSWQPALTELERAYKSDEFKKVFPSKKWVNPNFYIPPTVSEEQQDEFEKNRQKLKNFDWTKK